jgi:hypothetical protein
MNYRRDITDKHILDICNVLESYIVSLVLSGDKSCSIYISRDERTITLQKDYGGYTKRIIQIMYDKSLLKYHTYVKYINHQLLEKIKKDESFHQFILLNENFSHRNSLMIKDSSIVFENIDKLQKFIVLLSKYIDK